MLELIKPEIKSQEVSETRGTYVVEPLERGFGYSLGNSMRRLLLSSLPGSAITAIRIDGVPHEFSALTGVKEDVVDIILNLKQVVISGDTDEPATIKLSVKGAQEVTAGDLEVPAGIEIVNKDHHIMSVNSKGEVEAEFEVRTGRGYVSADKNKEDDQPIGVIPIDSVFTPTVNVNYEVENTRVGQRTDYDKLILHVETNGAIDPDQAMETAATIMSQHMALFVHVDEDVEEVSIFGEEPEEEEAELNIPIEQLELSVRSYNCLKRQAINSLDQLVEYTEQDLMNIRNFGDKSIEEIKQVLASRSLALKSA